MASVARLISQPQPTIPVARPMLPLAADLAPFLERIDGARWYTNFGPLLTELEGALAARFAEPVSVATASNGTVAITLALRAQGARQGGLCAMPAWTFPATAHAAIEAGLIPWFLDVDPITWMLDAGAVKRALAEAPAPVSAVVPVSAFGAPMDLAAWRAFADETGLPVVADAAAAFDTLSAAPVPVSVSLHATKLVSTGEGGFVAAEDPVLVTRIRELTAFGFAGDRRSRRPAMNAKLSEYAAAVGLASLAAWRDTRRQLLAAAQSVRVAMALAPDIEFQPGWGSRWISSTCVVRVPDRAASAIASALGEAGIESRAWWGEGCHRHPAFASCPRSALTETERLAASTLGLPFAVDLGDAQVWRIVDGVMAGLGRA